MVAPTIVNAIESGVDPEAACTALKLCDSAGIITQLFQWNLLLKYILYNVRNENVSFVTKK